MKATDNNCQICRNYDTCDTKEGSDECKSYEYYKCIDCIDRLVDHDEIPVCFRGGIPCMDIRYCDKDRTE